MNEEKEITIDIMKFSPQPDLGVAKLKIPKKFSF